ncbi:MAGE family-domain-containing protein [Mycena olivaceomarginata]|nr:MAGE family-domain-containing protein [Mycena olivaceomarginata]
MYVKPIDPRGGPSQPARSQKRRVEEEEEDEEEEEEDEGRNMDVDEDDEGEGDGKSELDRAAYVLVRLAMFAEHKRVPLRRDEISKKALGSNTRAFNRVFAMAQNILRNTFGMARAPELDKDGAAPATQNQDLDEARKAAGVKKKYTPFFLVQMPSVNYTRSRRRRFQAVHPALRTERTPHRGGGAHARDHGGRGRRRADDDDGSGAGRPHHVGALGVLYVVLALILVSGRVMGDRKCLPTVLALPMLVDPDDLRATLKRLRLRLPAVGTIGFSAASTHRTLSLDAYLTLLIRQGFLDRQQVGGDGAGANKKGGAKGRRTPVQAQDDAGGQQTYEWRWGARAQSEVGRRRWRGRGMGDAEEDAGGSGAGRAQTNKKKADAVNKLERMAKGIERAAGGQLAEIMWRSLSFHSFFRLSVDFLVCYSPFILYE